MNLTSYRTLGRSGLIVSPFALGTMTFGAGRWGTDGPASREILNAYMEAGGNFIDTADIYSGGLSEEFVGEFQSEGGLRDHLVIATKFTWSQQPGNPNAGGNGRKNVYRALDASLKRLKTDYVDLYWQHFWDMVTPVEEMLDTFVDLIRAGKIRYYALSDVPAWYMARMATLAGERAVPGPIALQTHYSLVERSAEFEHLPAARELGISVQPWSPLAGGFLSGKYRRGDDASSREGRLAGENPSYQTPFTDRNWDILEAVQQVAEQLGRSPAEIALAWLLRQPAVDSLLIGVSSVAQVHKNMAALDVSFSQDQMRMLQDATVPTAGFPWSAFTDDVKRTIFGGSDILAREWR